MSTRPHVASPVADQVHQDPTPYAGARCCNGEPKIAARATPTNRVGGQLNQDEEEPQHRPIMPRGASRFEID